MPGWHKATKQLQDEGRLLLVGIIQEQHAERCRLFMQWQQMSWPVMVDALNITGVEKVPLTWAIDEYGIVRAVNPDPATIEKEFVNRTFPAPTAPLLRSTRPPDLGHLQAVAAAGGARAWRDYGDALFLWGADPEAAIVAYRRGLALDPTDAATHFRLGVALRRRYDSPQRHAGSFQEAVNEWSRALALNPNQYIWRRRIQQYGPRLDKPYPFYDWVTQARADIRARGEEPVLLPVEPQGSELAVPTRTLMSATSTRAHPDPRGLVHRDTGEFITVETVVVPATVAPGGSARVHLLFRPNAQRQAHWNNEAEPLRVWLELSEGWMAEARMLEVPLALEPISDEPRTVEFELQVPAEVPQGIAQVPATAFYYVCEERDGTCLYRRRDLEITIPVGGDGLATSWMRWSGLPHR